MPQSTPYRFLSHYKANGDKTKYLIKGEKKATAKQLKRVCATYIFTYLYCISTK